MIITAGEALAMRIEGDMAISCVGREIRGAVYPEFSCS